MHKQRSLDARHIGHLLGFKLLDSGRYLRHLHLERLCGLSELLLLLVELGNASGDILLLILELSHALLTRFQFRAIGSSLCVGLELGRHLCGRAMPHNTLEGHAGRLLYSKHGTHLG